MTACSKLPSSVAIEIHGLTTAKVRWLPCRSQPKRLLVVALRLRFYPLESGNNLRPKPTPAACSLRQQFASRSFSRLPTAVCRRVSTYRSGHGVLPPTPARLLQSNPPVPGDGVLEKATLL